ncbi:MAG: porin family protein [Pseudomonadales bacterium]|jgi:hypothetical protein
MTFCRLPIAVLLLCPVLAFAAQPPAEIRYDYVDVGVTFGEVDTVGNDIDFSSFDVAGSWDIHKNIALIGRIGVGEIDVPGDIDTSEVSFGINPHFPLTDKIDLIIPVAIEWADYDGRGFSDDDTGYSIGVGIRALPNPQWEFSGGFRHVDIFDNTEQSVLGSARWHINELFSLSVGAEFGDDTSAVRFGGRFSF